MFIGCLPVFVLADPGAFRVAMQGYGPVRVGMDLSQAARASGLKLVADPVEAADSPECYYANAPALEGVSFMVYKGRIARVDVDAPRVKTLSGVGIGDTEARVRQVYGASVETAPHKYGGVGDHYLTVRSADRRYAVRFETYQGTVTRFYAGEVERVEGRH